MRLTSGGFPISHIEEMEDAMTLQQSLEGSIDRAVLQAVAAAIRRIEPVTGSIKEYRIGEVDAELLCGALNYLWAILGNNDYTIDAGTNRLRRVTP